MFIAFQFLYLLIRLTDSIFAFGHNFCHYINADFNTFPLFLHKFFSLYSSIYLFLIYRFLFSRSFCEKSEYLLSCLIRCPIFSASSFVSPCYFPFAAALTDISFFIGNQNKKREFLVSLTKSDISLWLLNRRWCKDYCWPWYWNRIKANNLRALLKLFSLPLSPPVWFYLPKSTFIFYLS